MKYLKIKTLDQYNSYVNKHEALMIKDESMYKDEIELLEVLIEDYQRGVGSTDAPNPVELLKMIIEDDYHNQKEFAQEIGISVQLLSDILNYRRRISKKTAKLLSDHLAMTKNAFLQYYDLKEDQELLIAAESPTEYLSKES